MNNDRDCRLREMGPSAYRNGNGCQAWSAVHEARVQALIAFHAPFVSNRGGYKMPPQGPRLKYVGPHTWKWRSVIAGSKPYPSIGAAATALHVSRHAIYKRITRGANGYRFIEKTTRRNSLERVA